VKLFLDTSVLLAACGSDHGASHAVFDYAPALRWTLISTPYVVDEVLGNLPILPSAATSKWARLRQTLILMDDVLTLDRIVVFEPAKDRPILFSALAWSDALLTLDRRDFGALLGRSFYGLPVLTPAMFLQRERDEGRLTG